MSRLGVPRRAAAVGAATALALSPTLARPAAALMPGPEATHGLQPAVTRSHVAYNPSLPGTWSNGQLAAQMTFACIDYADAAGMRRAAAAGYGGITLLGTPQSGAALAAELATVRHSAAHGVTPFIASDEEGGLVQRLSHAIYPLPSAKTMGATWSAATIKARALAYGRRMRGIGVSMSLSPVSDLLVPGSWMDSLHRAFASSPAAVAADAGGFAAGLTAGRVAPVIKHWPGHGSAVNTHVEASTIPPLSTLVHRDLLPFVAEFHQGVTAVMVGHLRSAGLTEGVLPATESPHAMAYLRQEAGPHVVIMTDSLDMAAATTALHRTIPQAAVAAIRAGADVALSCTPRGIVPALTNAIVSGRLSRAKAIASVTRILAMKRRFGVVR